MPEPLRGLVVLAELIDPTQAHLMIATLQAAGIDATLQSDPRNDFYGVGVRVPRPATGRVLEVVVRAEDEGRARQVLDEITDDLPPEFHDDEVLEWLAGIEDREARRKVRSRRARTTVIVIAFVVIVAILLVGAASGLRG